MGLLISPKLYRHNANLLAYYCPGCRMMHPLHIGRDEGSKGPVWQWNKDTLKPTLTPSLLHHISDTKKCHLFITDGKLVYLSDCHHELRGQTIDMPDVPEDDQ